MVRYSFLVRLSHPLLHAGLSRRLLDHPIGPYEHIGWDRHTDLLGGIEIDDKLELLWLLYREIGGLGAFENFVDIGCGTPVEVDSVRCIRHQATSVHKIELPVHRWESVLFREIQ